jgi:membrane associated rhomboid family serine protease
MFLHQNLLHLALNMIALWIFGRDVEQSWGKTAFLKYYFITGIGAGMVHTLITPHSLVPTIGASGAVLGVLTAFALLFPEREITLLLFFILPVRIKAKTLAWFYCAASLIGGVLGSPDRIAHFAHLGGMVVGWLYLKRKSFFPSLQNRKTQWRWKFAQKKRDDKNRMEDTVNRILDKANDIGMDRLSWKERRMLKKASKKLRRNP